jgi:poly(3-hydroxybutyrate) depolymerase
MRIGARNLQTRATVRTIVFQGDKDDNSNANRVISQSKTTNRRPSASAGRRRLYPHVYTDEFGRDTMEQWVVHGLGHPWSGSSSEGSSTDPSGQTPGEMVRFFLQPPRQRSGQPSTGGWTKINSMSEFNLLE